MCTIECHKPIEFKQANYKATGPIMIMACSYTYNYGVCYSYNYYIGVLLVVCQPNHYPNGLGSDKLNEKWPWAVMVYACSHPIYNTNGMYTS